MATPEQVHEAILLREAGYTTAYISERVGLSARSLARIFQKNGTRKGAIHADLIEQARKQLVTDSESIDFIKSQVAGLLLDDIAQARRLRDALAEATEHLAANDAESAAVVMRALAAASTTLKNLSDVARRDFGLDRLAQTSEQDELPELVVAEMTNEDVLRARRIASGEDEDCDNE